MWEKLAAVSAGYSRRFADGDEPFQLVTRLLEECGELAQQVNHFEGTGVKREKYGSPDKAKMAKEIKDVLHCTLRIAQYYGIEQELVDSIEQSYQRLRAEGYIKEKLA